MRAIGYLSQLPDQITRPNRDGDPVTSLVEQNARVLAYCEQHGFEPTAIFLDADAVPGRERYGMVQLLRHLSDEARGFTVVVAQSFEHLGSDPTQSVRTVLQLRARGVQVVTLDDGAIDDASLVELWQRLAAADNASDARRERLLERARLGQAIGRPPYGYRVGSHGRYEIDDEEAKVVRRIFHLSLQDGLGIRRIAQRLNAEGFRTRRGRNWSMVTIRDLLRNPVYTGRFDQLGVSVEGNHPAIVSEADFRAVGEQMEQRRTATGLSQPSDFLLAGLVWCGEDQSRMIGVTRRQQRRTEDGESEPVAYRYYQSEARTNQSVGDYHTRRADELEAEVLAQIRGDAGGGEAAVLAIGRDDASLAAETAVALSAAGARLRAIDRRLAQLLEDAAAGESPALQEAGAEIVAEWESANADLLDLKSRAQAHERDADRRRLREQRLRQVRDNWDELPFTKQRELVEHLVERVVVFDESVTTHVKA